MSRNVFILGAGASKEVGAPLMKDFLDVAADLARMGKVNDVKAAFDLVAEGRSALQSTHSKSVGIDIYNMEAVFSAFEMAKMLGGLSNIESEKVKQFPSAYRTVINETLEKTIQLPVQGGRVTPGSYSSLIEFIIKITELTKDKPSILSFNYDMILDYACHYHGLQIDYGLNDTVNPDFTKVLKLHGSLNWTECCVCKKIVPWKLNDFFQRFNWDNWRLRDGHTESVSLTLAKHFMNFSHCNDTASDQHKPFIVPPTWNKSEHHHAIENVWKHAAKELAEAENIFIIGYSLPETDTFFHYLFSLGISSPQLLRRVWVVDPDPSVEIKYKKLVSNAVLSRFRFFNETFKRGIQQMSAEFSKTELIQQR